jgi:hypothetical protein
MSICQTDWRRRSVLKIMRLAVSMSNAYALELTVPHKTIAEVS